MPRFARSKSCTSSRASSGVSYQVFMLATALRVHWTCSAYFNWKPSLDGRQ